MHIVLIVVYFPPNTSSTAKLWGDLAEELRRVGCRVTVITTAEALDRPYTIESQGALSVLRVRTGRIYGERMIVRASREVLLSRTMWKAAGTHLRELKVDALVYCSPSIFFGPLVMRLKKMWNVSAYMVQRDFFPDWVVEAGMLRKGLIYRYFKSWERSAFDASDRIAVQSPANVTYFRTMFPTRDDRVDVLYNWTAGILPSRKTPSYRSQLKLDGKVVFFYGGNIGVAQDMDNLLRLARALENESLVHFLFVGTGSEVPRIRAEIDSGSVRNLTLLPAVSQTDYLTMLQEFDIGLISLDRRLNSANLPGKLLGYLECGMPTLASINPGNDLADVLSEAGAGFCSENGDDAALLANARALAHDSVLRNEMGAKAKRLLEDRFHVRSAAAQILDYFALPQGGVRGVP